jgi:hypothetical protein
VKLTFGELTVDEAAVLLEAFRRMRLGKWSRDGDGWVWIDLDGSETRVPAESVRAWARDP